MSKRKGLAAISQETGESYEYTLEERMADIFTEQFNKFCATGMDTDEELTKWLYIQYLDVLGINPLKDVQEEMVFFRSSSTGSCLREQTMKVIDFMEGTKRADKHGLKQPHQTRWTALGTAIGDIMQFFVLLMEKHYERLVGEPFAFRFERDEVGHPMFEQFTTTYKAFKSGNMQWATGGSVDGIMIFTDPEDGADRIYHPRAGSERPAGHEADPERERKVLHPGCEKCCRTDGTDSLRGDERGRASAFQTAPDPG